MKRWLLAASWALATAAALQAAPIKEIRVVTEGAGHMDIPSVLAFVSLKAGDDFTAAAVDRDIKSLQQSGRFSGAAAEVETIPGGVVVIYRVTPRPKIRRLEITGADFLGNRKVRELLELGVGDLVDDATLGVRARKVTEQYRKKYFPEAKLAWTLEPAEQAGTVNVKVAVVEGKRATVRRIRFEGARKVGARELLKVMKQRRVNWLSWVTGAGTYNPDDLETDRERLRKAYMDRGYLDSEVGEPAVSPVGRRGLRVDLILREGQQYRVGRVALTGVTLFPQADVERVIGIRNGQIASMEEIAKSAEAVRNYYGGRGYVRTVVRHELDIRYDDAQVDVRFTVTEGKLAYIRDIDVRGNSITKDKVIRRELAVYPGEIFDEVRVERSERRLRNLGLFSYVASRSEETDQPDRYDLTFEVEEQKTGQLMVGAGFSSVDDLVGFAELAQGNFDIAGWPRFSGGGQKAKIRAQFGTKRSDYEVSFVEPWFLNRRLSLGVDLFLRDSRYFSDEYDQRSAGGRLTLGQPLRGYFSRGNLIYDLENIEIMNVSSNASQAIRDEEGKRLKSALTLELIHDTRDNVFVPTRGNRTVLSATGAGGLLAGDTDFYSAEARTSQYFPLWFDHVFSLRGWTGGIKEYGDSDEVPIFDRFFLGGARTLRGFKYRDVGPKDEQGEPVGGRTVAYGTAEYSVPVAEKIRFAAFYDVGMVWEDTFRYEFSDLNDCWGVGVRFDLPGFPIQLDYSWPITADEFNDDPSGRFSFWIGYAY
jgi:outer membrane protein insertion porin family